MTKKEYISIIKHRPDNEPVINFIVETVKNNSWHYNIEDDLELRSALINLENNIYDIEQMVEKLVNDKG